MIYKINLAMYLVLGGNDKSVIKIINEQFNLGYNVTSLSVYERESDKDIIRSLVKYL